MTYDYAKFNHANPFELKLTGGELECLLELLDKEWIAKGDLPGELQEVRANLHNYLSNFHSVEIATI